MFALSNTLTAFSRKLVKFFFVLIVLIVCNKRIRANDLRDFLVARILMYQYEKKCDSFDLRKVGNFLKYKNVNFGYNDIIKHKILIGYYYLVSDTLSLINQLKSAAQSGLILKNIPSYVQENRCFFNMNEYTKDRNFFLGKSNEVIFTKMLRLKRLDQMYSSYEMSTEIKLKEKIVRSYVFLKLKEIEEMYGWSAINEISYDLYNNYDSCRSNWSLFSLIGHFDRNKLVYFRNKAILYAQNGKISWDDAILLQQWLAWSKPIAIAPDGKAIFPFESLTISKSGFVNTDKSLLELFTLGFVVLRGHTMRIEIFPTKKAISCGLNCKESIMKIKDYLSLYTLDKNAIKITSNCLFYGDELKDCYFGYKVIFDKGGVMNWYPPYSLFSW